MKELVYVSRATQPMDETLLHAFLKKFRINNQANDITGVLLFDGAETFIQVIEGEDNIIDNLYSVIQSDPHHTDITLIYEKPITKHAFKGWQMGFKILDRRVPPDVEGFSDFMKLQDKKSFFVKDNQFMTSLIEHFKQEAQQEAS